MNSSLNDAAALLIQVEPDDVFELQQLKEMFGSIVSEVSHPKALIEIINRCTQKIEEIIEGGDTQPDEQKSDILSKVNGLVEEAMNVLEENIKFPEPDHTLEKVETNTGTIENKGNMQNSSQDKKESTAASDSSSDAALDGTEKAAPSQDEIEIFIPPDSDLTLTAAFLTESIELIGNAEEALLALENDPEDVEAVATVFRAFHTVKGTSSFLELTFISKIAHLAESVLSRVRDNEIRFAGGYPDLALRSIDVLKELMTVLQNALSGKAYAKPEDYDELMEILADPEKAGISDEEIDEEIDEDIQSPVPDESLREEQTSVSEENLNFAMMGEPGGEPENQNPENQNQVEGTPESKKETEDLPKQKKQRSEEKRNEKSDPAETNKADLLTKNDPVKPKPVKSKPVKPKSAPRPRIEGAKNLIESTVRVPTNRLDRFIDMVGELVVAHSMVAQDSVVKSGTNHELEKKVAHTTKIVRELQHMSMSMRMIPLKTTFQKMARLVRDLSRKAGKSVNFLTEGEDTEIDRNMVDVINDPLVHMVRNAVDHGLESPEERLRNGKQKSGIIKLSAYHAAGNVVVEITDDGKGLDRKAIIERAIERGLVSRESVQDMEAFTNDQDVFDLIFEPGFSTAKIISDVSGRGVGMDVVKTNIDSLRGQIEISSKPQKGCVFKISLPLTLAIIDGMVVRVGNQKYVIPTVSIVRSVQPEKKDISTVLNRGEMLLLQEKLIPIFRLSRLFDIDNAQDDLTRAIAVIVENGKRQAGLLIDELIGTQQIVIKTLGDALGSIKGISGSAIMPNGRVGLILDVEGLVKIANED